MSNPFGGTTTGYHIEKRKAIASGALQQYRVIRESTNSLMDGSVVGYFFTRKGAQRWIDAATWVPVDHV